MKKPDLLKESVSHGLAGILTATAPAENPGKRTPKGAPDASAAHAKEPAVHCNFLIEKSLHRKLKHLSVDLQVSLRDLVREAMTDCLRKYDR